MAYQTNPGFISDLVTTTHGHLQDGASHVIHTGIIKAMNIADAGSFVAHGMNIDSLSTGKFNISAGGYFGNGDYVAFSEATNATPSSSGSTAWEGHSTYDWYGLICIDTSGDIVFRKPSTISAIKVADPTSGDIPLAVVQVLKDSSYAATRKFQFLGMKKVESALSIGQDDGSNGTYDEKLKINKDGTIELTGNTGKISFPTVGNTNSTLLSTNEQGIANGNSVKIDHASVADDDYAKFTANGLEGRSAAEVKSDLGLVKGDVGLGNVDNTTDAGKPVSTATQTALDLKATIASPTFTGTVSGITKAMVGLTNVIDTSDADKPMSTATQTALNAKATTAYVDSIKQGLDTKDSCVCATTANITLSGTQTIDTISVSADDRVLVKNQSDASENGIYLCKSGSWVRTDDANANADVTTGLYTWIEKGSQSDTGWILTTEGAITVDTTDLSFTQFSGAGQITAGDGLVKSGNTITLNVDDSSVEINSDALRLKAAGVTNAMLAGSIAKSKVDTTGTWAEADVPTLAKSKISTTGTWVEADIPTLAKSKVSTTGTWATADIPSLAASKITSGTLADARIASAATWNAKQAALTFDTGLDNTSNTVSLDFNSLTDLGTGTVIANDYIPIYAADGTSYKKVSAADFMGKITSTQVAGSGKIWADLPASAATVGATAGTDLKDSGANVLADADVKNTSTTWDQVRANSSTNTKPADGATVGGRLGSGGTGNILLEDGSTKATESTILNTNTTKANVGLGNVDNTSDATKQTATLSAATKSDVGLGNVDNTADTAKPVSTAQQTALDAKVPTTRTIAGRALSNNLVVRVNSSTGKLEVNDGSSTTTIQDTAGTPVDVVFDNRKTEWTEIQDASSNKPANSATVGAVAGTNLKAADGSTTLGDADIKNASIASSHVVGSGKVWTNTLPEDGATTGKLFFQAGIPTSKAVGDLWFDSDDDNRMYIADSAGADQITSGEWESIGYPAAEAGATVGSGTIDTTGTVNAGEYAKFTD